MDKIVKRPENLPDTIDKLNLFIQVGKEKLKAYEAKLRAMGKVGMEQSKEARKEALQDTQEFAVALLYAEVKMGKLIDKIDKKESYKGLTSKGGRKPILPKDITHKQSYYAQQLFKHLKIIEDIINKALKREDLPRRASVIKEIERRKRGEPNILEPIEGQHEVIVIDPPWPYGTIRDLESRRVASPYKELSLDQIKKFELPTAENCVLWLWTTHKFLRDAFDIIDVWEFKYKLNFVWDKEKLGMGSWLRCQAEFCLLATKGKPRWNLINERDILQAPRGRHSAKPDEFYDMVKRLCPTKGKYADIFFRKERSGWKGYGDTI